VDRAARLLRARIFDGTWAVGAKLPPERTLAVDLDVNRLTLRAALAGLEAQGLVRARQGDGVRVLDLREHAGLDVIPDLVAAGEDGLVADLFAVRRAVAAEAVALACGRARPEDLAELEALAGSQATERDPQAYLQRDLAFARLLVRAARSLPMELLLNTFAPLYRARPGLAAALFAQREAVNNSYRGVIALVAAKDPELARDAVRSTLELIDRTTLENLTPEAPE